MAAERDEIDGQNTATATALVPYAPSAAAVGMVRPLVDHRAAAAAIAEYEALKAAIVRKGDVQVIQGREFLKKSFWRRVATCFGLSLELVSEARGFDEGGKLYYSIVYRAVAPNGRSMIGDGYCSTAEAGRGGWPEHNVRATAHTRAKNRAISDLVGGGEVSAEELPDDDAPAMHPQVAAPRPAVTRPAPKSAASTAPRPTYDVAAYETLRQRALDAGVTANDWADVCQEQARTTDPARMTAADKVKLATYVVRLERAHERAQSYFHDEPDAGGPAVVREPVQGDAPDLRDLDTGAPGN